MPTSVSAKQEATESPPAAEEAAAEDASSSASLAEGDGIPADDAEADLDSFPAVPAPTKRNADDEIDVRPLADDFQEALFTYPKCDPTPRMRAAYAAHRAAKHKLATARRQREGLELSMAAKLGRVHNLLRESKEREDKARTDLRKKTAQAYEAELDEKDGRNDFNVQMARVKAFIKRRKRLPPTVAELDARGTEDDPEARRVATFVAETIRAAVPHHLASLANVGVDIPVSDEDAWHHSLRHFQVHAREYWDNPLLVQTTHGDVLASIMEYTNASDARAVELQTWCKEQQDLFQRGTLQAGTDRFHKLADAGFTFDVIVDDKEWNEHVEWVAQFQAKYGHVHIPAAYVPPSLSEETDASQLPHLQGFVDKVRSVVHRDVLSPPRMVHLKKAGVYLALGGRVYDYHVQYCKVGRAARGEAQRTKRKFAALEDIAERREAGGTKKVRRNNMDNWVHRLEKLVAYIENHGTVDVENDVKLRMWTYSVIRKLSINSRSLRGQKMKLIEGHDGLKELLLRKENVAAAVAEAKERKAEEEARKGRRGSREELDELTEGVLLGEKEDEEVNAFMESGLHVPAV